MRVLTGLLRCGHCFLIATETVAQHRGCPLNEAQPGALTPALRVFRSGLYQLEGIGFPARQGGQRQGSVRDDAAARRLGYRLHLRY